MLVTLCSPSHSEDIPGALLVSGHDRRAKTRIEVSSAHLYEFFFNETGFLCVAVTVLELDL